MIFKKMKVGLAIGGGGVRSISALGVIKNMEKEGIKIRYISGTSMGAVTGALYSHYLSTEKVKGAFYRLFETENYRDMSDEFSKKLGVFSENSGKKSDFTVRFKRYFSLISLFNNLKNNISLIDKSYIKPVIDDLIPDIDIKDLQLPFCCVAADIKSGKKIVFKEGSLKTAIMSTIAIPGIIAPEKYNNMLLTDGMVASLTPVEELRSLGAGYAIAVEVMARIRKNAEFSSGLDILERANTITAQNLHKSILSSADLVVSPPVKNIFWANFDKIDYCIKAGLSASFGIKRLIK